MWWPSVTQLAVMGATFVALAVIAYKWNQDARAAAHRLQEQTALADLRWDVRRLTALNDAAGTPRVSELTRQQFGSDRQGSGAGGGVVEQIMSFVGVPGHWIDVVTAVRRARNR